MPPRQRKKYNIKKYMNIINPDQFTYRQKFLHDIYFRKNSGIYQLTNIKFNIFTLENILGRIINKEKIKPNTFLNQNDINTLVNQIESADYYYELKLLYL